MMALVKQPYFINRVINEAMKSVYIRTSIEKEVTSSAQLGRPTSIF
jgi:hypothetical protein